MGSEKFKFFFCFEVLRVNDCLCRSGVSRLVFFWGWEIVLGNVFGDSVKIILFSRVLRSFFFCRRRSGFVGWYFLVVLSFFLVRVRGGSWLEERILGRG